MACGPRAIDRRSLVPDSVSAVLLPTEDIFVASLPKFTIPSSHSPYNVLYSIDTPHNTDEGTRQIHDIISTIGLPPGIRDLRRTIQLDQDMLMAGCRSDLPWKCLKRFLRELLETVAAYDQGDVIAH